MKRINYKEKGITLIALVITIIILLILAGVTLNTALSQNGLFQRAKIAGENYKRAESDEEKSISEIEKEIDNIDDMPVFSEKDFYFDQNLNNLYISSKFKAEELVYEARLRGVNSCCLRIGNISSRYSDGIFQKNIEENAILSKLKSFMEIGYIPDYLLNVSFDFTQVDICSDAILKIANTDIQYSTFHIVNNNIKQMKELIDIFEKLSIDIKPVPEKEFMEIFESIRQNKDRRDILMGIIQDWIRDKEFRYHYDVIFNSDFTNKYLQALGFTWVDTNQEYFEKYINYLRKIGYIGGKNCG